MCQTVHFISLYRWHSAQVLLSEEHSIRTNSLFAIYLQILHPDKPHPSRQCMEFISGIWELVSLRNLTGSPDTHLTILTMRQNKVSAKSFDVGKENSQE